MNRSPPLLGDSTWRRPLFALATLMLLAGCATGDFGEIYPSLVGDDIHDWVAEKAIANKPALPSDFPLTDDERALRDLAYPLIEAPYDRHKWYSIAGEYGWIGANIGTGFDRGAYWSHLCASEARSPSSRYARLTDDIRNDTTRLPQFFETATRVLDVDGKRYKSMAYVSDLGKSERKNALRRIYENAQIVAMVRLSLAQRVTGYRYALGHLIVETPSQQGVDVERVLNHFEERVGYYRTHPTTTWKREPSLASAG